MRRVPPQSLTWRGDVEPYPAISYLADRVANERRAAQDAAAQTPPAPEEAPDHAA